MADIKKELNDIKNAVYGKEVRGSIHDGIKKINDEVENATDLCESAKHQVENIQQQVNQLVVEGDSSVEAAQARVDADGNVFTTLKERLDTKEAQAVEAINEVSMKIDRNANMYWIPPTQPPARIDRPGYFADGFNWTAQQYIDNLFEPLRLANRGYITRDILGKDASGTYDVYRYYFTPKKYSKTIIIGTCLHGGEVTPMLVMYRFLYHLINDWDKYPQLSYIRHNVRIIYIPFQNPWGVSQRPRTRQNANGVDLNRNFDYKWSEYTPTYNYPFGHDYKGTAPFSEVETQYIRSTLDFFKDATVYLDLHNLGTPDADYVLYNSVNAPNQHIYDSLIDYLVKDIPEPEVKINTREMPSAYNYSFNVKKIVGGTPEWADGRFGDAQYDSTEITKALEWFGNIIIQHARNDLFTTKEPFVIENYYTYTGTGSINMNVGSYADIPQFNFSFDAPCDGLVLFEGAVTILGTDQNAINYIQPKLGQYGTDFLVTDNRERRHEVYNEGSARSTLPFYSQTYVKRTWGNVGRVAVGISAMTTAGTCTISRYRARITFIPSEHLERFKIYSAVGRENEGGNAMIRVY